MGKVAEPIGIPRTILPLTYFIHLPMKMELIVSSEMSAIRTQTPGNYPKRKKLHLEHGESLKTRIGTEYFKHGTYFPFFPLQNAVCFIILTYLVPVLFTFYLQGVLYLKKIIPAPKD